MKSFLITILIFGTTVEVFAQINTFKMNQINEIGSDDSNDPNFWFSRIGDIAVNSSGDIYAINTGDNSIRVFDTNGVFLKKIGSRGRGPGEFLDLTSVFIDINDSITVVDRFQDRISRYNANGELIESYLMPESSLASLRKAIPLHDNQNLLLLYKTSDSVQKDGNFVHILNINSGTFIGHYLDVFTYFFDKNKPIEVEMSSSPSYLTTNFSKNKVAVTPRSFTGTIATFNTETFATDLFGVPVNPFYIEYNFERRDYYRSTGERGFASISGMNGRFFYKRIGITFGLVGNSKYLVHFYMLVEGKGMVPFVNIYSDNGELILKKSLVDSTNDFFNGQYISLLPRYLDENNVLYFTDSETQKIRIYSTNLDEIK